MNRKKVKCKKCGSLGQIHGSGNGWGLEGPYAVCCLGCGTETLPWVYQREAWKNWAEVNSLEAVMKTKCPKCGKRVEMKKFDLLQICPECKEITSEEVLVLPLKKLKPGN